MGTILVNKYDFTSLQGISIAFRSAFPKSEAICDQLNKDELKELTAKRNLIAHKGGIIDEEYCKKLNLSLKEIGGK
jgi:hypothetical protein